MTAIHDTDAPVEPDDVRVVRASFRAYADPRPHVLNVLSMNEDSWARLPFYARVHANEFYELVSQIVSPKTSVLEWGSGLSTYILAHFCREWGSQRLITVDDNADYQRQALAAMSERPSFLEICHASQIGPIWPWDDGDDHYATLPVSRGCLFDLVFVDGRRRNECLLVASQVLAEGGTVILHDSWRTRYDVGRRLFETIGQLDEYTIMTARRDTPRA